MVLGSRSLRLHCLVGQHRQTAAWPGIAAGWVWGSDILVDDARVERVERRVQICGSGWTTGVEVLWSRCQYVTP